MYISPFHQKCHLHPSGSLLSICLFDVNVKFVPTWSQEMHLTCMLLPCDQTDVNTRCKLGLSVHSMTNAVHSGLLMVDQWSIDLFFSLSLSIRTGCQSPAQYSPHRVRGVSTRIKWPSRTSQRLQNEPESFDHLLQCRLWGTAATLDGGLIKSRQGWGAAGKRSDIRGPRGRRGGASTYGRKHMIGWKHAIILHTQTVQMWPQQQVKIDKPPPTHTYTFSLSHVCINCQL